MLQILSPEDTGLLHHGLILLK